MRDIYKFEDKTDEDKLCALIRDETTLPGRLTAFYDYLSEEDQKKFQRQGIINSKNDELYLHYQTLSEQEFFKGGSNKAFLNDVLKTMDLSKEKSTMEYLRNGAPENDPQRREKLGIRLHLSDTATALRDETQLQVLQKRGDSEWLKANIADAFAKSICAGVSQ